MTSENTSFQHASSLDFKDISRWGIDTVGWHLVPGPNDLNGEGGLPSVQPETTMMQFQVMPSKAGAGCPSEEFLKG